MSAHQAWVGVEAPARLEAIGVQHQHRVWRPGIGEHLSAAHVVPDNTIMRSQTVTPSGRPYHPGDIAHPGEAYDPGGHIDLGNANSCAARALGSGVRGGQQLLRHACRVLSTRLHHGVRGVCSREAMA